MKMFSLKRNWEQMEKLDSFCKKLQSMKLIFQFKQRSVKYQLGFL